MNERARAVRVITKRRLYETLISPGYYVAVSLGLVLSYLLVNGFLGSIDSTGLNFANNRLYDQLSQSISGLFGETIFDTLLSEGPYSFALYVALAPVLLFLAAASVHRYTTERNAGAIELVSYGPADETAHFLAGFVKDVLLTFIALIVVVMYFVISAAGTNLVISVRFFRSLLAAAPLIVACYAYVTLAAAATDNTVASLCLFFGGLAVFAVISIGSFALVGSTVRSFTAFASLVLRWVSPLYYWQLALDGAHSGNVWLAALAIFLLIAVAGLALWLSDRIVRRRRVKS